MNNKKLIILSGAGDPEKEKFKQVYNVIVNYAKNIGYDEIQIQGWKGQTSFSENGFLNLKSATELAISLFEKAEADKSYDVICRSFGTGVFLNMCQSIKLKKISFVSLWGIPTYTAIWEIFKEKINETIISSKNKGVNIDRTFFDSIIPFDLLLNRFNQDFRVNVVNGSEDIYSPPAFNNFLRDTTKMHNQFFSQINGLPHEVTEYHQEYLEKLFENK